MQVLHSLCIQLLLSDVSYKLVIPRSEPLDRACPCCQEHRAATREEGKGAGLRVPLLQPQPQPRTWPERPREMPEPEFVWGKGHRGAQRAELARAVHPEQAG